jgi:magnesium-protoporphyrin O-methyltransferase
MFGPRFARRMATRYRRRGLDKTARRVVDLLPQADVLGATILEIGGGVGEIQLELLKRGAASATNLELSPAYDAQAAHLLADAGLTGRVRRRLIDIVADPPSTSPTSSCSTEWSAATRTTRRCSA